MSKWMTDPRLWSADALEERERCVRFLRGMGLFWLKEHDPEKSLAAFELANLIEAGWQIDALRGMGLEPAHVPVRLVLN